MKRTSSKKLQSSHGNNRQADEYCEEGSMYDYDSKKFSEDIKKNLELSLWSMEVFQEKSEEREKQLQLRVEELEKQLQLQETQFAAEWERSIKPQIMDLQALIDRKAFELERKTGRKNPFKKKINAFTNDLKKKEKMKEMEELIQALTAKHCKLDEELQDARKVIASMVQNSHAKEDIRKMTPDNSDGIRKISLEVDKIKLQLAKERELKNLEKKLKLREARLEAERIELRTQKRMRLVEGTTPDIFGVKIIGELDRKPFQEAMKRRFSGEEADENAIMVWSCLRKCIKDPTWLPFKFIVDMEGNCKEILPDVENDGTLKFLKNEYGEEVCKAVTEALLEMNEYPRGRYIVSELWNHQEKKKATRKEVVQYLLNLRKGLKVPDVRYPTKINR